MGSSQRKITIPSDGDGVYSTCVHQEMSIQRLVNRTLRPGSLPATVCRLTDLLEVDIAFEERQKE